MHEYKQRLLGIVKRPPAFLRLEEQVRLASGAWSDVFIDGKVAVSTPAELRFVGDTMRDAALDAGAVLDAVGGLVLGAAPFAVAVSLSAEVPWFLVRKEPKGRGTNRLLEGAPLEPGMRVMLVDDVITSGGSIQQAFHAVEACGVEVAFATTLVDRSDVARAFFDERGVPYRPLLTYVDLGIDPVETPADPVAG